MTGFRLVSERLELTLGRRRILDGLSLSASPGEIIGISGPSGAGKSSLLLVLAGVLAPDAGSVEYESVGRQDGPVGQGGQGGSDGRPAGGGRDLSPRAEPVIGLVPQTLALAPVLTAAENVAIPLQLRRLAPQSIRDQVADALSAVGLADLQDRLVTELSGGQRQRVAVARTVATCADVILADEATAELDAENQSIVLDLLAREAGRGALVILATHDQVVVEACSRAFRLDSGVLWDLPDGSPSPGLPEPL